MAIGSSALRILQQPYPPPSGGIRGLIQAISFGAFIGGFLLFFRPFDLNIGPYETGEILIFGLISTFSLFLFQNVITRLLPSLFKQEIWQVWHQLCFYLLLLFVIATLNGLYINYLNELPFSWTNYGWIISRTLVLGSFPIGFFVLFSHNQKLKLNAQTAHQLETWIGTEPGENQPTTYQIQTQLKDEIFTLEESSFLYANASGNYLYIYTPDGNKHIYRLTMNSFEEQLPAAYLVRCHRSYLVNLQQVESISGNAQGLSLHLHQYDVPIPVSRKYITTIRDHYQQLQD